MAYKIGRKRYPLKTMLRVGQIADKPEADLEALAKQYEVGYKTILNWRKKYRKTTSKQEVKAARVTQQHTNGKSPREKELEAENKDLKDHIEKLRNALGSRLVDELIK